ncbi:MAG: cation transporter [Alphaproteobacteria bacterium]|nr:cation transporter [Alphaproteobacteria bacterium]
MGKDCCAITPEPGDDTPAYRRVLWAAFIINLVMFLIELAAGLAAGSVSLQADALDFFGDAANYIISLFVLNMALHQRAQASLLKGAAMGLFGLWVAGATVVQTILGTLPHATTMGVVGLAAFAANGLVLVLLWKYKSGDSNRQSVWLCTRNDVIGNLAVILAALGVLGTGTSWPDIIVAAIMSGLALHSAWLIVHKACTELKTS